MKLEVGKQYKTRAGGRAACVQWTEGQGLEKAGE